LTNATTTTGGAEMTDKTDSGEGKKDEEEYRVAKISIVLAKEKKEVFFVVGRKAVTTRAIPVAGKGGERRRRDDDEDSFRSTTIEGY